MRTVDIIGMGSQICNMEILSEWLDAAYVCIVVVTLEHGIGICIGTKDVIMMHELEEDIFVTATQVFSKWYFVGIL